MSQTLDLARGRHKEVCLHLLVGCCFWWFLAIITMALCAAFPPFTPYFRLERLYVPGLNESLNASKDSSITFDIYLENFSQVDSVYFDPMNVEFYDGSSNQSHSVASFTFPKFTLMKKSHVEYNKTVNATGLDLDAARQEIAARGFKEFKMNLEASVRYPAFLVFKTKRHRYRKSADVKIDALGVYSAATKYGNNFFGVGVLAMLYLLVGSFLCSC